MTAKTAMVTAAAATAMSKMCHHNMVGIVVGMVVGMVTVLVVNLPEGTSTALL